MSWFKEKIVKWLDLDKSAKNAASDYWVKTERRLAKTINQSETLYLGSDSGLYVVIAGKTHLINQRPRKKKK